MKFLPLHRESLTQCMLKYFLLALILLVITSFQTKKCLADTYVGGTIASDTAWTKINSPYVVTNSIMVADGVKLIIDPGVIVKFDGPHSIFIEGILQAIGTESEKIKFTTNTKEEYWGSIYFRDSSVDATFDFDENYADGSILEYCIVEYAEGVATDSYDGAIRTEDAGPFLNYCIVRYNKCSGISYRGPNEVYDEEIKITNCQIQNNSIGSGGCYAAGVILFTGHSFNTALLSGNVIKGNRGGYGGGVCTSDCNIEISNNIIIDNISQRGGGIYILANSTCRTTIIDNNIIANNEANDGGGVYSVWAEALSYNQIISNTAETSAGVFSEDTVNLHFNLFIGNKSNSIDPSNTIGIKNRNSSYNITNYNNIFKSCTYSVKNYDSEDSNFENNWWSVQLDEIDTMIYDLLDDPALGRIDYLPHADVINSDAPISPPQDFEKNQCGNQITLSWSANPEIDTAGYKIYWGTSPGYPYNYSIDVGNVTTYKFANLPSKKYYFSISAYDQDYNVAKDDPLTLTNDNQTAGHESWFSDELEASIGATVIPVLLLLLE